MVDYKLLAQWTTFVLCLVRGRMLHLPLRLNVLKSAMLPLTFRLLQGVGVVMQIQAATYRGNKSGSYNFLFSFGDHRCRI